MLCLCKGVEDNRLVIMLTVAKEPIEIRKVFPFGSVEYVSILVPYRFGPFLVDVNNQRLRSATRKSSLSLAVASIDKNTSIWGRLFDRHYSFLDCFHVVCFSRHYAAARSLRRRSRFSRFSRCSLVSKFILKIGAGSAP